MPRRRSTAFLLKPVDLAWLALIAAVSCALALFLRIPSPFPAVSLPIHHSLALAIGGGSLTLASAGVYLTGLRIKDRPTAVISGLLATTSLALATGASWSPQAMLLAALVAFALFAYSAGWTVAALCLAGAATFVRADGLLLGIALAIVALCQCRRNDWAGAVAFLLIAALVGVVWIAPWHAELETWLPIHAPRFPTIHSASYRLLALSLAPVAWFLFPYLAEWATAQDRAKWWAPALWASVYLVLIVSLGVVAAPSAYLPLLPVVYLMVGAGIARLLPAFAGELPVPLARYMVATAAVGVLLCAAVLLPWFAMREWAQPLAYGMPILTGPR